MTPDKNKTPQKVQAPVKPQAPQQAKTQPAQSAEFSRETLAILFKAAKKASEHAYAPYSRFKVGAVLLLEDGRGEASQISAYTGCNVENASYGLTCCAERIAIYKAVSDGNKKFKAMILYASAKKPVSPCGACRQVLAEFASADMKIYSIGQFKDEDVSRTSYAIYTVAELLPHGFKASDFIEKK
ncbi:MAG TPA: cytidine deaminase [Candidatus Wallbacteria bacterium]|nr:cytidine deaminase [Candidatus Wallbacteria bacterium]